VYKKTEEEWVTQYIDKLVQNNPECKKLLKLFDKKKPNALLRIS